MECFDRQDYGRGSSSNRITAALEIAPRQTPAIGPGYSSSAGAQVSAPVRFGIFVPVPWAWFIPAWAYPSVSWPRQVTPEGPLLIAANLNSAVIGRGTRRAGLVSAFKRQPLPLWDGFGVDRLSAAHFHKRLLD